MLTTYVQIFIASIFIIFLIFLGMSTPNPNSSHRGHNDHSTHNHNHNNYNAVQRAKVDELVKLANDLTNDFEVTELAGKIQKDGFISKDELELLRIQVKISIIKKYR